MEDRDPPSSVCSANGPLAQLVEQLTLNQRVRSSSLRRPTNFSQFIQLRNLCSPPQPAFYRGDLGACRARGFVDSNSLEHSALNMALPTTEIVAWWGAILSTIVFA